MKQPYLLGAARFSPQRLLPPNAWIGHLPFAAWLMQELSPKLFVELGTHTGNSYFSFCQAVREGGLDAKCFAIDTWRGDEHSSEYGEEVFIDVNEHNNRNYSRFSQLLRMTFDEALNYFSDGSIDLLHIDGFHTYDAVRHDFETWLPKMKPDGVILLHDTNVRERNFGVWKLWEQLQECYKNTLEFTHSHGLGVVQLSGEANHTLKWLSDESIKKYLIDYFAALGGKQCEFYESRVKAEEINRLNLVLAERDNQVSILSQEVSELEGLVDNLNLMINDRDNQIVNFSQAKSDLVCQVSNLQQEVTDRDSQIVNANLKLEAICNSTSWRITSPLRFLRHLALGRFDIAGKVILGRVVFPLFTYTRKIFTQASNKNHNDVTYSREESQCDNLDYAEWIARYEFLTEKGINKILQRISLMPKKPLISVLMTVDSFCNESLERTLDSIVKQLYRNWELIIAVRPCAMDKLSNIIRNYEYKSYCINVLPVGDNEDISASLNSALNLANGEFIALIGCEDCINESSLFWIADAIASNSDAGLIYSDEDKLNKDGVRYDPHFKSDWNPDLFLSYNYIGALAVYRTELVKSIGGFQLGYEGAEDYDLALRCIESLLPMQIVHVPRVLYHRNSCDDNNSLDYMSTNIRAVNAGLRAINNHLARTQLIGMAEMLDTGMYRVRYEIPDPKPLVSLIIPTKNGFDFINRCVNSVLEKTLYLNYEIIVIDNNSDDPKVIEYLKSIGANERILIISDDRPFNFSALNNAAIKKARGEIVGLINNDVEVITPEWLDEMVSLAIQPGVGAVGARLWYPDDTLQHGGCITGLVGIAGHSHKHSPRSCSGYFGRAQVIQTLSAVTAACLLVKKEVFNEVGGLDEENLMVAYNDIDFCLRVKEAGYRNVWTPYAELYHHESATRGYEDTPEKRCRFEKEIKYMQERWGESLYADPAYNPNLTLASEDFSFAWPPRVELMR